MIFSPKKHHTIKHAMARIQQKTSGVKRKVSNYLKRVDEDNLADYLRANPDKYECLKFGSKKKSFEQGSRKSKS